MAGEYGRLCQVGRSDNLGFGKADGFVEACEEEATYNVVFSFVRLGEPESFKYLTGRVCEFHKEYIEDNTDEDGEFISRRIVGTPSLRLVGSH